MYSRFTDITNGLAGLGKTYEIRDMVRKILSSLLASWTPKVTAIEEANDLKRMSLEKLIGSLMAHEINMERLGESSSRKKHSNALKVTEGRYFKKRKDFKKLEVKDVKKSKPICYECKKLGHIKAECPNLKKMKLKKKENSKKFRRYKKKAMVAAWNNESDSYSESSSSDEEEENANLAFVASVDDKVFASTKSYNVGQPKEEDIWVNLLLAYVSCRALMTAGLPVPHLEPCSLTCFKLRDNGHFNEHHNGYIFQEKIYTRLMTL
ncbi:hypothetical protein Taro_045626 [Colocasia esculenta]|uniref:CCHC-type domain-containing protein n=1 Tax=Colocasia esculenta TaxID=4460 RepID=A0A843WXH3_COLES|nr:hypothetical protein [Colocasia esculenta]